jgi:gliding motility-associated-like protein
VFLPVVNFRDRTAGIPSSWQWDFGDLHHAIDQDPTHTYLKPGKYPVSLFVETAEGCKDSAYREIIIKDNYALYAPTAFTPNNDGENDVFTAIGTGITKFKMILFDRWGKLYFTSDDLSKGWDGTINGISAPEGVYTYRINYTDLFGGKHEYLNAITLVR